MKNSAFTIERDILIRKYQAEVTIEENEFLYGQYTMVSSNLINYLPEIDPKNHMQLFIQLLIHKRLSKLEQSSEEALSYLTPENLTTEVLDYLQNKPAIICTFHTGSYRIINSFLVKNGIPFTLAIGKSIISGEGQDYYTAFEELSGGNQEADFKIIDAESPNSGLQMLRELKRGRVLLLYIDGNSGAGANTIHNENSCIIEFLNQQIHARVGIGYLAHAAKVPLFPVINYRASWNDIRLRFYDAIWPSSDMGREVFAMNVTQKLYDTVAPFIRQNPEQWEAWLYLHRVARISNLQQPESKNHRGELVLFNLTSYGLFQINQKPFLFQKNNYTSYPIDLSLYNFLKKSINRPVNKRMFTPQDLIELHKKGVLYYL